MFDFSWKGEQYTLVFSHRFPQTAEEEKKFSRISTCELYKGRKDTGELLSTGQSWCSKKDQFSRAIGRLYALERCLDNTSLSDDLCITAVNLYTGEFTMPFGVDPEHYAHGYSTLF